MPNPGDVIGGCRILATLGSGGMGTVYRALQLDLKREVALKVMMPAAQADSEASERFLREARTAAAVSHPNVVAIYAVGQDQGRSYLVQELITGGSARDLMKVAGGKLGERRALELVIDCCAGLQAIADAGLVHRDIKPENILLTREGRAKLADFGLARNAGMQGGNLTVTGITVGTPAYMSPEQAQGAKLLDIRSDLYALGATLYCLVTGVVPFEGETAWTVVAKMLTEPVPDPRRANPQLSDGAATLILRAMAREPAERFASPKAMGAAAMLALGTAVDAPAPGDGGPTAITRAMHATGNVAQPQVSAKAMRKTSAGVPTGQRPRPGRPTAANPTVAIAVAVAAIGGVLAAVLLMRPAASTQPSAASPQAQTTTAASAVPVPVPPPAAPTPPVAPPAPKAPTGPLTLIPRHADWRYHDRGSDLGSAWRAAGFDDHEWKTGPAPLGYGDPWIITQVDFGDPANRHRTTYYRHAFTVPADARFTTLDLTLMRDDGAVLYLNGREVARSNMPDGQIGFASEAKAVVGNADEQRYWPLTIEARDLLPGRNVIAVEIHQFGAMTTDQSFDLDLIAR